MCPTRFIGDAGAHQISTDSIRELLNFGIKACTQICEVDNVFALGPISCNIFSNSVKAFNELTHCLFPIDKFCDYSDQLSIYILCGEPVFGMGLPSWNFPHTDTRHRERLHISGDGIVAYYDADFKYWMILDIANKRALFWIARFESIPFWEKAAPFKSIINWFLSNTSFTMLHGGAVSLNDRAVLLVGPGGSGKSSTVGTCFLNGMEVCGDDLVIVGGIEPYITVYALYNSIKLLPSSLAPALDNLNLNEWDDCGEKRFSRYSDLRVDQISRASTVIGVMRCFVSGQDLTTIMPIQPSSMLKFIIPPTVFLLRGYEELAIKKISRLVRSINCFQLNLGTNSSAISKSINTFIEMNSHAP
jgi:hypothetical protein